MEVQVRVGGNETTCSQQQLGRIGENGQGQDAVQGAVGPDHS